MPDAPDPSDRPLSDSDVVAMAELVSEQLSNTTHPRVCPVCLYKLAAALWHNSLEATVVHLVETNHAFWSACAATVSAPGTTGDVTRLRLILADNVTFCSNARHVDRSLRLRDNVAALMDTLCTCIYAALSKGPHRDQSAILRSKNGAWPTSLGDVAPTGIGPYVRWACILPTPSPLAIICQLFFVARRTVMRDLLVAPSQERLVLTVIRALRQWRLTNSEVPDCQADVFAHDVQLPPVDREDRQTILSQVYRLTLWLVTGPDLRLDDLGDLARGYEAPLHDALIHASSTSFAGDSDKRYILVAAASMIASAARLPLHPLVQEFRQSPDVDQVYDCMTIGQAVYLYISRVSLRCAAPNCDSNTRAGSSHSPAMCSPCRIVRYCSVQCQRLDWKVGHNGAPHRIICGAIHKIIGPDRFAPRLSMSNFVAAYNHPSILTRQERRVLAKAALRSGILPSRFDTDIKEMLEGLSKEGRDAEQ
ncbi:hypothetical protein AURDEDRAFT_178117 [Auricularia subglabra TFB-10046 SS5]|uniref:MYND-type domain-containing protein n=1 Tax=Auricularia subglabra (strain TFB-10046 / SS5) TaxID=717982 RepID=J0WLW2_AURST|nr:hypothetical protein AURDEDRAFT_178117 [Auricularia subglabra TFB-10046 SS5]